MDSQRVRPEIGQWYMPSRGGERFRVVGLDDRLHTIEIQSFEGDLGEFDIETWRSLALSLCPDPEDWMALREDVATQDWGDSAAQSLAGREALALL